jgi:hypothetical protein
MLIRPRVQGCANSRLCSGGLHTEPARAVLSMRREGAAMAHGLAEAMANMMEEEALRIIDGGLASGEEPNLISSLSSEAIQVLGENSMGPA